MNPDRQRVNVQVSVRLDQIGAEVRHLLNKAQNILTEVLSAKINDIDDTLSTACYEKVNNVRLDLGDADAVLQDVMSIVNSYNLLVAQSRQPQEYTAGETTEQSQDTEESFDYNMLKPNISASELEEKLAMFRSTIEDIKAEHTDVDNTQ